ncbi:DUF4286 family protein [Bacteroidia bacterium]|nr:DUF4286 family protein [Bacteroidia bacterium]
MIIYNVTLSINPEIEKEAIEWLTHIHIPEVMQTNLFISYNIYKIIENPMERTHNSYAIQYTLASWLNFEKYSQNHAFSLQEKTRKKFGENILAFRTFLEKI